MKTNAYQPSVFVVQSSFPTTVQQSNLRKNKLAPVQAVSHGHPLTSGIPATIMDYYISWGLAELGYDVANTHYTEELKLLPTTSLHQYYTPRADENISLIDGMNYRMLVDAGRLNTFPDINPDGHWYTCMQKPFKRFPGMFTRAVVYLILFLDP